MGSAARMLQWSRLVCINQCPAKAVAGSSTVRTCWFKVKRSASLDASSCSSLAAPRLGLCARVAIHHLQIHLDPSWLQHRKQHIWNTAVSGPGHYWWYHLLARSHSESHSATNNAKKPHQMQRQQSMDANAEAAAAAAAALQGGGCAQARTCAHPHFSNPCALQLQL